MTFALPDKWIWDFWLTHDDGLHHLFYLQAPRSLGDPNLRHWNVSIGHAVSKDLRNWELRPDALAPSEDPAWDDRSTWTGSILRHEGKWHMFYTGTSDAEDGQVQRVGLAVSDDLDIWEKVPGPLIAADPRWYEDDDANWHDVAWRDPWVFEGEDGMFHALITGRERAGDRLERGAVAYARSHDLLDWEVMPPLSSPGGFGQLEVPQIHQIDDDWFLLFCSDLETQSDEQRANGPGTGTYYVRAPGPLGPFDASASKPLQADALGTTYAGRLVDHDGPKFLAWLRDDGQGGFVGELSDPFTVTSNGNGLTLGTATP